MVDNKSTIDHLATITQAGPESEMEVEAETLSCYSDDPA